MRRPRKRLAALKGQCTVRRGRLAKRNDGLSKAGAVVILICLFVFFFYFSFRVTSIDRKSYKKPA